MATQRTIRRHQVLGKVEAASTLDDMRRQIRAAGVLLGQVMNVLETVDREAHKTRVAVTDYWPSL